MFVPYVLQGCFIKCRVEDDVKVFTFSFFTLSLWGAARADCVMIGCRSLSLLFPYIILFTAFSLYIYTPPYTHLTMHHTNHSLLTTPPQLLHNSTTNSPNYKPKLKYSPTSSFPTFCHLTSPHLSHIS